MDRVGLRCTFCVFVVQRVIYSSCHVVGTVKRDLLWNEVVLVEKWCHALGRLCILHAEFSIATIAIHRPEQHGVCGRQQQHQAGREVFASSGPQRCASS
jgi:hypothetical protein